MKRNRLLLITIICLCCLAIVFLMFFNHQKSKQTLNDITLPDGTIIRGNVSIITADTAPQPIKVTDNELIFDIDPLYPQGEVIVSGVTETAPYGFIRRVIETLQNGDYYIVKTEPALLTDVFRQLHMKKQFALTDGNGQEIDINRLNTSAIEPIKLVPLNYVPNRNDVLLSDCLSADFGRISLPLEFENEIYDGITLDGKLELSAWAEVNIDITPVSFLKSDIDFSVIGHTSADGDLDIGFSATKEYKCFYEESLFSKKYITTVWVGHIPIVITNEIVADLEIDASINGTIGLDYELLYETANGFKYSSKTNHITEINDKKFVSDGLGFNTTAKAEGEACASTNMHLVTLLYDSAGLDLSVGVEGSAEGELEVSIEPDENGLYLAGSMDLAIGPKIEWGMVAKIPTVDDGFIDFPPVELKLSPWWEKHWEFNKAAKPVPKINVYKTKFGTLSDSLHPSFSFEYSNDWKIVEESVNDMSENVKLVNARGASIEFAYWNMKQKPGGSWHATKMATVSKVADSNFVPSQKYMEENTIPNYNDFMIAKVKCVSQLRDDGRFVDTDGNSFYAILPKNSDETIVFDTNASMALSFKYKGLVAFVASEPPYDRTSSNRNNGKFTEEEKQDIIAILTSFKSIDQ